MRERICYPLRIVQGAIGKKFVIKHYSYGVIKTKYPDMTRIIASMAQRNRRNLFKEAVAFAKEVIADKQRKKEWQKRIRRRKGVYNAAIKFYMLKEKRDKELKLILANKLLVAAMRNAGRTSLFTELQKSGKPDFVALGDGSTVERSGIQTVHDNCPNPCNTGPCREVRPEHSTF